MFLIAILLLAILEVITYYLNIVDPYIIGKSEPNQYIPLASPIDSKLEFRVINHRYAPIPKYVGQCFNNFGLKGPNIDLQTHSQRIILLGDSFVQSVFLNESESLHRKIQEKVQTNEEVEVLGAAISRGATDDFIAMLFHRVIHLQPSVIVLFLGAGDVQIANQHGEKRYLHLHHQKLKKEWTDIRNLILFSLSSLHTVRALMLLYSYISGAHFYHTFWKNGARRTIVDHGSIMKHTKTLPSKPYSMELLHFFERNVKVIISSLQSLNIKVLLCLQPTAHFASNVDLPDLPNGEKMKEALNVYYKAAAKVGKSLGVQVCNLSELHLSVSDYFDAFHLTAAATEKVANIVSMEINNLY